MRKFSIIREQLLQVSIEDAWDFFSNPENLAAITPPEWKFKIVSRLQSTDIFEGMIINYIVRPLFGIPLKWRTRIVTLNKPFYFVDEQIKGPYQFWEHRHTFIQKENGVLVRDEIIYQLPFGFAGKIIHSLLVQKKLEEMMDYRANVLEKKLNYADNIH